MAMPGQVKGLPSQYQMHPHVQYESLPVPAIEQNHHGDVVRQKKSSSDENQMLKFPSTRAVLWDHKCVDTPVHLHISYYRKPKLCVLERVIRFAQRHLQSSGQHESSCALVGSLSIDEDGEGVKFTLDRFDPGGGLSSSIAALMPGDMAVPLQIMGNTKKDRESSAEDYLMGLKVLKQRCCAKEPLDVGSFLLVKGWCNFYSSGEKSVHHLEFDIITMGTEFKATPITPVPIVPTALSKNLSGPMSLSHLQGEPKTGYLTMDHTRKVLLVLESDPKVFNLPLVGIWVSGVPFVYSPFVWAACLRYLHNSSITDRICSPPEAFLLVLYSPVHSKPEFYEIVTVSGTSTMDFDLLTGYEVVSISKSNNPNATFDVDLNSVKTGQKREVFDGALHRLSEQSSSCDEPTTSKPVSSTDEITPRNIPAPHRSQLPHVMPMVPEVSLLFGEDGQSGIFTEVGPKRLAINQGRPHSVNHVKDFAPQRPLTHPPTMPAYSQHPPRYSGQGGQHPPRRMPLHSHSAPELNQVYQQNSGAGNPQPRPNSCTAAHGSPVSGPGVQHYMGNMALSEEDVQMLPKSSGQPVYHQNAAMNGRQDVPHTAFQNNGAYRGPLQPGGARMTNGYDTHNGQTFPGQAYQQMHNNYNMPQQQKQMPYNDFRPPQQVIPGTIPRMPGPMRHHQQMPNIPGQVSAMPFQHPVPFQPQTYSEPRSVQADPFPATAGPNGMYQYPNYNQPSVVPQPQHQPNSVYPTPASSGQTYSNPSANGQVCSNMAQTLNGKMIAPSSSEQVYTSPAVSSGKMVQGNSTQFTPVSGGNSVGHAAPQSQDQRRSTTEGDSSKSSDDSGLSFTPEKGNNAKTGSTSPPDASKDANVKQSLGGSDINWNQVPKEVYQLLLQQDAQLKQLQSQIQMLMHSQSASTQCTTMTDLPSSMNSSDSRTRDSSTGPEAEQGHQTNNMCSVGVNTTLQYPQKKQTIALQTSPQKGRSHQQRQQQVVQHPYSQTSSEGPHPYSQHSSHHSSEGSQCSVGDPRLRSSGSEGSRCSNDPRTPAEIRHRGVLLFNSTEREEEVDVSQGDLSIVMDNVAIHNQTVDSVQSEIIVDLPSYQSSPSRSVTSRDTESNEFSKSPLSASMCGGHMGEEGDSEDEDVTEDNTRQYYDKLMDNIHKMLNQQSVADQEGMDSGHVEMTRDTLQQSIMLGQHLGNSYRGDVSGNPVDTTYIPKINYMSMLFDSDSDTSMEINAMAMKYLNDEQLTQLSKAHAQSTRTRGTSKSTKENQRLTMLKHVLHSEKDSTPNVTTLGMSPNDMTFATRKYMEKHGLLNETNGDRPYTGDTMLDDSYRLKVDYSTTTSGSETPVQVTPETVRHRHVNCGMTPQNGTPSSHNVSGSPFVNNQHFTDKVRSPLVNGHLLNKDCRSPSVENAMKIGTPQSNFTPVTPKGTPTRAVQQFGSPQPTLDQMRTPISTGHRPRIATEDGGRISSNEATPIHPGAKRTHPLGYPDYGSPFADSRRGVQGERMVLSPIAREPSPPPTPVQQAQHSPDWQSEDDNILDITRLKTLPKLL